MNEEIKRLSRELDVFKCHWSSTHRLASLNWDLKPEQLHEDQRQFLLLMSKLIAITGVLEAVLPHGFDVHMAKLFIETARENRVELQYQLLKGRNTSQ